LGELLENGLALADQLLRVGVFDAVAAGAQQGSGGDERDQGNFLHGVKV
jgi:hypothetical protein